MTTEQSAVAILRRDLQDLASYIPDNCPALYQRVRDALATEHAAIQPASPEHVACSEGGVLRWMTGRKVQDCELYTAPVAAIQPAGEAVCIIIDKNGGANTGSLPPTPLAIWINELPPIGTRLYAAPISAAAPVAVGDVPEAVQLLGNVFDAWENGDDCYEEGDVDGSYMGKAFRLDDDVYKRCCDLLNRVNPPRNAPAYSDNDARILRLALETLVANPAPLPMMPTAVFDAAALANREAADKARAALTAIGAPQDAKAEQDDDFDTLEGWAARKPATKGEASEFDAWFLREYGDITGMPKGEWKMAQIGFAAGTKSRQTAPVQVEASELPGLPSDDDVYQEMQARRDSRAVYISAGCVSDVMQVVRDLAEARSTTPAAAPSGEALTDWRALNEVVLFLMGAEPLEGVIFGERHPTKAGLFWWRLNLRAAMCRAKG